jgi:hypothetical protein
LIQTSYATVRQALIANGMVEAEKTALGPLTARTEAIVLTVTALGPITPRGFKGDDGGGGRGGIRRAGTSHTGRATAYARRFVDAHRRCLRVGAPYTRLHVVCNSFGSVVAIDSLFPTGGSEPAKRVRDVHTLITVGCPFDFIRSYFDARGGFAGVPRQWLNIYREDDVAGFRGHGCYWTPGETHDCNVYNDIVKCIYGEDPLIKGQQAVV